MICVQLTIPFVGNKTYELFLIRFRYAIVVSAVEWAPSGCLIIPFGPQSNMSLRPLV